jgi:hypothetical protein
MRRGRTTTLFIRRWAKRAETGNLGFLSVDWGIRWRIAVERVPASLGAGEASSGMAVLMAVAASFQPGSR